MYALSLLVSGLEHLWWGDELSVGDGAILGGIVLFLSILAVVMPYVNEDFGQTADAHDPGTTAENLGSDINQHFTVWSTIGNIFSTLGSILVMFLWSFGSIPWFLDALLIEPIRIIGYIMVIKILRGVG